MQEKNVHYLRENTVLNGKYVIRSALGEGGFGITYLGWDKLFDKAVAIKEFFPSGIATRISEYRNSVTVTNREKADIFEAGKVRFLKEAKVMVKCGDIPGVVDVRDYFEANSTAYIVMDYLNGVTLKNFLKVQGALSAQDVRSIMTPIVTALAMVHEKGYIHRDISPDNIMLMADNNHILMDFGAARNFAEHGDSTMTVLLKHGYAPPEQYQSHGKQGPWTDIYALCATIYRCLTGKTPPIAYDRVFGDKLEPPSKLGVSVPPQMEAAILKGLRLAPEERYQNLKEFCGDFYGKGFLPPKTVVPDVAGMSRSRAEAAMAAAGFKIAISGEYSGWHKDVVIRQGIAAGTEVDKNTAVPVVVSLGLESDRTAEKSKKKNTLIVAVVVLCLLLGGGWYVCNNLTGSSGSKTAGNTTEVTTDTKAETVTEKDTGSETTEGKTASQQEDTAGESSEADSSGTSPEGENSESSQTAQEPSTDTSENEGAQNSDNGELPFQDEAGSADYSKCLDLDIYSEVVSPEGDYTFSYPMGIFNSGYTEGDDCIFVSADGNDSAKFMREEIEEGVSPRNSMRYVYFNYKENMTEFEELYFDETRDPDSGYCYAVGCGQCDGRNLYIAVSADDTYVYTMEIYTSHQGRKDKSNWTNYYIECMYRACSFTRDVGEMRTFEEYIEDN